MSWEGLVCDSCSRGWLLRGLCCCLWSYCWWCCVMFWWCFCRVLKKKWELRMKMLWINAWNEPLIGVVELTWWDSVRVSFEKFRHKNFFVTPLLGMKSSQYFAFIHSNMSYPITLSYCDFELFVKQKTTKHFSFLKNEQIYQQIFPFSMLWDYTFLSYIYIILFCHREHTWNCHGWSSCCQKTTLLPPHLISFSSPPPMLALYNPPKPTIYQPHHINNNHHTSRMSQLSTQKPSWSTVCWFCVWPQHPPADFLKQSAPSSRPSPHNSFVHAFPPSRYIYIYSIIFHFIKPYCK